MKIFFLILLTISVCAVNCFSQSETTKAADWKTFAPQNEEFSVEVPIPLTASIVPNPSAAFLTSPGSKRSVEDKDKNTESRRYLNSLDGTYFYVFSDDWKEPAQFRYVLNFVYDQNQIETTQNTGELTTKKYEFPDSWDFYHIVLTVNAKNRVYIFHTISTTKENPMVERFFGSIKFDEKTLLEISSGAKTDKSMTVTIPTADQEKTDTAPPGKTIISNGGLGIKPAPENKTPVAADKVTAGVKILSKPRANYTDFARFYEISGKVVLRVVFSANGTIGSISPIAKLPFGLTAEASAAARKISFEPAVRAGVPYSVVKPVEYTFTIY